MDEQTVLQALAGLPLGPVRYLDSVDSTNAEAVRWLESGAPDRALVAADGQTHARGRMGRTWYTPAGSALAFSLALRFAQTSQQGGLIGRLVATGALAVSDALSRDYNIPTEIKWPNDVLIQRRKVAGVLCEAQWQGKGLVSVVLGVGVNVNKRSIPPAQDLNYPATCVESELGGPVVRYELLRNILSYLLIRIDNLDSDQFLQDWENRLAFRGEWVQIIDGRHAVDGQALGVNEDGSLRLLTTAGEVISVYAGDVHLRPTE